MYKLNNEFEINYNKEIIPKKLNPDLDKKLEKEVNFFLKWGYLIIDKAPTKPSDNTMLDLMVITIRKIETPKSGKILPINDLFDTEFEYET